MEWYTDGYMHCTIRGEQFEITRHWDEYLRFCFGDYMELPPEEMRNPRHFFDKYR